MTTWNARGQLATHGEYLLDADGKSVADGLWTFWHDNGQVRTRGHYLRGEPVGCVSFWDDTGTHHTARWSEADKAFESIECKGPSAKSLEDLEDQIYDARSDTVWMDFSVGSLFSRGGFGIRNDSYTVAEPNLSYNLELSARRHLRFLRLGGVLAKRTSEDGDHQGWVAAATLGVPLPSPDERLALDASLALGIQRTEAELIFRQEPRFRADSALTFLGPYLALELGAGVQVHRNIELVLGTRVEGGFPTEWETTKIFVSQGEQPFRHEENWQVGRYSLGVALGIRVSLF